MFLEGKKKVWEVSGFHLEVAGVSVHSGTTKSLHLISFAKPPPPSNPQALLQPSVIRYGERASASHKINASRSAVACVVMLRRLCIVSNARVQTKSSAEGRV